MLKDIRESQRIDRTALGRKCIPVSACVISSHFWPKIVSETVSEFPAPLEEALVEYEKSFMDHKESRKLQWMRAVGWVLHPVIALRLVLQERNNFRDRAKFLSLQLLL
ncbi:hypothetical protein OESDEN_17144 [Oesophagostomum dentatum]|uniref:Cullin family profile domain-containing protein n=1 Tax=Oesophagostomum dentatum TaxID=61180 RepID=A0A0B1SE32_OESDE|nr:hypothetical protein OESDEN_17144 [Oesophagostomum dentatum]